MVVRTLGSGGGGSGGGGDVSGPASAVDDHISTFDGPTGKLIQDGGATIAGVIAAAVAASGNVTGPASALDDHIATYDGITGKLIQDGGMTIAEVIAAAGGLLQTFSATVTNAQIKAGGLFNLAVPASGKYLMPAFIHFSGKVSGGAYNNASGLLTSQISLGAFNVLNSGSDLLKASGGQLLLLDANSPTLNKGYLFNTGTLNSGPISTSNFVWGRSFNPADLVDQPLTFTMANTFTNGVNAHTDVGVAAAGTVDLGNFTSEQAVNSGSGTGAIFHITTDSGVYTVTLVTPGNNFSALDTLTFDGALLGGTTIVNDLVVTVDSVQTGTQDLTGGSSDNFFRFTVSAYALAF